MRNEYRQNASVVVFNKDKKVLVCFRADTDEETGMQFPQGGIESGENPAKAALRELKEETNITSVILVKTLDEPIPYDFPKDVFEKFKKNGCRFKGQEQYWSLCYFFGDDKEIDLNADTPEFKAYKWVDLSIVAEKIWEPKREAYKKMIAIFAPLIRDFEI